MVLQSGHLGEVRAIAFSPDRKTLASASGDGAIMLWNLQNNETTAIMSDHDGGVNALAFSRDGSTLVSGGDDKTIKIWNTRLAVLKLTLRGHKEAVRSVAFSPDGKSIASGSLDATAKLWDTQTGKLKQTFQDPKQRASWVNSVAFSPDGKSLAICAAAYEWGTTFVWDLTTRRLRYGFSSATSIKRDGEELENECVAYSPDGKLLTTATRDGVVKMWNAQTGKLRFSFLDQDKDGNVNGRLLQLVFSPDSRALAGTSTERTIKLWSAANGKPMRRFDSLKSEEEINDIAFSPNGSTLAAASANNIHLASVKTGVRLKKLAGNQVFAINAVEFSSDGKRLASGGEGQPLILWDGQSGALQRVLSNGSSLRSNTRSLAFSPDGSTLAKAGGDGVVLWNVANGKFARVLPCKSIIWAVAWSPDGKVVAAATGSSDAPGAIQLWNAQTGKALRTLTNRNTIRSLAFSPDGKTVAGGEEQRNGSVQLWDAITGKLKQTLKADQTYITSVAFSPDGERLLSGNGSDYPLINLWNLKTGAIERSLKAGPECAFSPDGKTIAGVAPYDDGKGAIRLWDSQTGALLQTFKGHGGFVDALQFRSDSKVLASGGEDGKIIFWDIENGKPLATLFSIIRISGVKTGKTWREVVTHNWITYTPDGYFTGSKDCEKFIRWRVGDELFAAEKYAEKYRRPDLIAQALKEKS